MKVANIIQMPNTEIKISSNNNINTLVSTLIPSTWKFSVVKTTTGLPTATQMALKIIEDDLVNMDWIETDMTDSFRALTK